MKSKIKSLSYNSSNRKNKNGFSLIEVIIAVTIIGVISAVGFPIYNTVLVNNKDQQRIRDLNSVKQALELYRQGVGWYPATLDLGCSSTSNISSGATVYLTSLPKDPECSSGNTYIYQAMPKNCQGASCINFLVCAKKTGSGGYDNPISCADLVCQGTAGKCDMGLSSNDYVPSATPTTPPVCTTRWYRDNDRDNFGDPNNSVIACSQPVGYVANNTDCYDNNINAKPGQTQFFTSNRGDGSYDYNCDGQQTTRTTYWNFSLSNETESCIAAKCNATGDPPVDGYCPEGGASPYVELYATNACGSAAYSSWSWGSSWCEGVNARIVPGGSGRVACR